MTVTPSVEPIYLAADETTGEWRVCSPSRVPAKVEAGHSVLKIWPKHPVNGWPEATRVKVKS